MIPLSICNAGWTSRMGFGFPLAMIIASALHHATCTPAPSTPPQGAGALGLCQLSRACLHICSPQQCHLRQPVIIVHCNVLLRPNPDVNVYRRCCVTFHKQIKEKIEGRYSVNFEDGHFAAFSHVKDFLCLKSISSLFFYLLKTSAKAVFAKPLLVWLLQICLHAKEDKELRNEIKYEYTDQHRLLYKNWHLNIYWPFNGCSITISL